MRPVSFSFMFFWLSKRLRSRPLRFCHRGFQQLIDIVHSTQHSANILYYEVLIAPLPELEKLKILPVGIFALCMKLAQFPSFAKPSHLTQVHFFNYRLEEKLGKEYHLDRKKKVQDLLHIAAQDWNTDRQLRLLEVSRNRIYKVRLDAGSGAMLSWK